MERLTMSVQEVSESIGVSKPTVYRLIRSKEIPSIKVGDRTLIPIVGLNDWINEKTQENYL